MHRSGAHFLVIALFSKPGSSGLIDFDLDFLVIQLGLQLCEEFVDDNLNNLLIERIKLNNTIEAIAEFRSEQLLDGFHAVAAIVLLSKTNRRPAHILGASVGCHDQHNVSKICLATVVVGKRTVIHHLQ